MRRMAHGIGLLMIPILTVGAAEPFVMPEGWGAFFRDPAKGTQSNIKEPLEKLDTKQWMGLTWTEFKGARIRLAVMPVENKAAVATAGSSAAAVIAQAYGANLNQIPVNGIEDLLSTSLQSTNRFRLFERKAIESVMAEKQLQASTQVAQVQTSNPVASSANPSDQAAALLETARKMQQENNETALRQAAGALQAAKLMGAQFLVYASVTEWTPDKKKKSLGAGGMGLGGSIGALAALAGAVSKSEAEVAMSFRVVDAATGEVKWSLDERATAGNWGFSLMGAGAGSGGVGGAGGGMQEKTPINYAVKACLNKAVYRIAQSLKNFPWRGAVIKASADGKVYINAGKDAGLEPGMVLSALSVGEALKDPVTGETLDTETVPAGCVQINEVRDRVAIGVLSGPPAGLQLKAGDRLEMQVRQETGKGAAAGAVQ